MKTIVKISGGLGNQMFQYAFGIYISLKRKGTLVLDITTYENDIVRSFELTTLFNIKKELLPSTQTPFYRWQQWRNKVGKKLLSLHKNFYYAWGVLRGILIIPVLEKISAGYVKETTNEQGFNAKYFASKGSYFSGFWQSEKYFPNIRDILLNEFTFKIPLDHKNQDIVQDMQSSNSISIHIRRGDYVQRKGLFRHHLALLPLSYYQQSIQYIVQHITNPKFFIFSDDIARVKEHLELPYEKVFINHNRGKDSYKDMQLMSKCKYNIIANSSFSWWGAWLNQHPQKIVIAPQKWSDTSENPDIVPKEWIRI